MDPRNVNHALVELASDPMQKSVTTNIRPPNDAQTTTDQTTTDFFDAADFNDVEALANSGLMTAGQLAHVQNVSYMTAYSLGEVILATGYLTREQLANLHSQAMADACKKTNKYAAGVVAPAPAPAPPPSMWEPMPEGPKETPLRIGELLESARVINNRELSIALSLSCTDTRKLGQIMVSSGFLTEQNLRLALDCQNAVARRELPPTKASEVLKHCIEQGYSIPEGIFDLGYSHDPTIIAFG